MQYTTSWKHHYTAGNHYGIPAGKDARWYGKWNIHRIAHVIREGGWAKVEQHWAATVYK